MQNIINFTVYLQAKQNSLIFAFFVKSDFLFSLNDDPGALFVSRHGIAVLVGSSLSTAMKNVAQ